MVTQMDVPVSPAGPGTLVLIVSIGEDGSVLWVFDRTMAVDGEAEPAMKVAGESPVTTVLDEGGGVRCTYPSLVVPGAAWGIDSPTTHVTSDPAVQVPQSGVLI